MTPTTPTPTPGPDFTRIALDGDSVPSDDWSAALAER